MAVDYVKKIKQKSIKDLVVMLDALNAGNKLTGWPPGKAFEHIILRAFELGGATVTWPYSVTLEGKEIEQIDGAVYYNNISCLIEAKDRDQTEGIEPIAKLRNQLLRRPSGTIGLVFITSQFSVPAKMLTRMMNPLSILLWEYDELRNAISSDLMCKALSTKYMYAVERGMPDYDTRGGLK